MYTIYALWLVWELRMNMAAHVRLINHFRRANYCNASSLVSYQEIYLGNKLLTKAITQTRRVDEYLHLGVEWFQTAACQPVVFLLLQRLICDCIWTGRLLRVTGALGSWTVRKRKSDQIWCHEENSASRRRESCKHLLLLPLWGVVTQYCSIRRRYSGW